MNEEKLGSVPLVGSQKMLRIRDTCGAHCAIPSQISFWLHAGGRKKHLQLFVNLLNLVTVLNTDGLQHGVIRD